MKAALRSSTALGGTRALSNVSPVFIKNECYWPSSIKVDQSFQGKLTIVNEGAGGKISIGLELPQYEPGMAMLFVDEYGDHEWHLDANQGIVMHIPTTMRQLLGDIVGFEQTKTIDFNFLTGYVEGNTLYYTDNWPVSTLVEVPANGNGPPNGNGNGVPTWAWVAGGVGLVAVVGVVMATRR